MRVLAAALCLFVLALPAQAHSEAELEAWLANHDRVEGTLVDSLLLRDQARIDIDRHLEVLLQDMKDRHPCSKVLETWTDEDCVVVRRSTQSVHDDGVSRGMGSNVEQWRPLVSAYFPADQVDRALCIMGHESGGNPNAQNGSSGASGLMQVLPSWAPKFGYKSGDLFDPAVNLEISVALWADGGWGHWSPYNRGLCR